MSDEIMEIEESFADMLERSIKTLNTGDKVNWRYHWDHRRLRSMWIWATKHGRLHSRYPS